MLIGGGDICNDAITLGTCFSMFVYICARFCFALIGGNLTAQSTGTQRGIGGGIQIPETLLQARSIPSFSSPTARVRELAHRLINLMCQEQNDISTLFFHVMLFCGKDVH